MGDVLYIGDNSAVRLTGSRNGSIDSFVVGMYGADGTPGYKSVFSISCTDGGAPRLEAAGDLLATENYVQAGLQNAFTIVDSNYSKARYQHTVTISGEGFEFCFTAPSSKNMVIDSYQDLGVVFGGERIGLTGYSHALSAKPVLIDLHGGSVNNDFIRVFEENGNTFANHTLSSLGAITFADDVYIPN